MNTWGVELPWSQHPAFEHDVPQRQGMHEGVTCWVLLHGKAFRLWDAEVLGELTWQALRRRKLPREASDFRRVSWSPRGSDEM